MPHLPGTGAIYGIVAEDGVPKNAAAVRLYDRSNGALVRVASSGADGSFAFTGLNTQTDDYQLVAQDDDGGPAFKNAEVVDRLTPTSMHVGTGWREGWYREMCNIGFQYFWPAPAYDVRHGQTPGLSSGYGTSTAQDELSTNVHNLTGIVPQVPELPSVRLNSGALYLGPGGDSGDIPGNTFAGNTHSFVAVIDFDDTTGWRLASLRRRVESSGAYDSVPMLRAQYNYATKVLSVSAVANTMVAAVTEPASARVEAGTITAVGSVTFTDRPVGIHMVTVVFVAGSSARVYLDGDTTPIIQTLTSVPTLQVSDASAHTGAYFSQYSATTTPYSGGVGQKLGFYARAQREVTAAEVASIYSWLFTADAPVNETGIRRAIAGLYPETYFELLTSTTGEDFDRIRKKGSQLNGEVGVTPRLALIGAGTDTTSPVVGSSAVSLPGTSAWVATDAATAGTVGYAATWAFHLKMNATDTGVIAGIVSASALTTVAGWSLTVSSGNKFSLILTGDATHTLTYTIPNATDLMCALVMDKTTSTSPTLKLYIDGALQETLNITETLPTHTSLERLLRIGGDYNGSVVSNGLNAVIGQFAKFNYALNGTQIAAIYDARLVP